MYDWIIATNISTTFNNKYGIVTNEDFRAISESRIISKCPARIFATNRTEIVNGRIKFLTNSIKNKSVVKSMGHPSGIQCKTNLFKLQSNLNIIKEDHTDLPSISTVLIWDVKAQLNPKTE